MQGPRANSRGRRAPWTPRASRMKRTTVDVRRPREPSFPKAWGEPSAPPQESLAQSKQNSAARRGFLLFSFRFLYLSFFFFFFFFWPCLFLKGIPVQILSDRDAMGKITRCMCFPPPRGRYTYSVKYLLKCVYFKPKQFFKEKILFCCCCCCSISEKYMTTGCSFWFLLTSNRCLCLSREQQEQKEEEQWGKKGKLIGRGFK